jgi:hypothetical protein
MEALIRFDPPNALDALARWRVANASLLAELPSDAIRIDVGRSAPDGGDFALVSVRQDLVSRFATREARGSLVEEPRF